MFCGVTSIAQLRKGIMAMAGHRRGLGISARIAGGFGVVLLLLSGVTVYNLQAQRRLGTQFAAFRAVSDNGLQVTDLKTALADVAKAAFVEAQSELMRAVSKGVVHKNTGSRKVSRLAAQLKKLSVA